MSLDPVFRSRKEYPLFMIAVVVSTAAWTTLAASGAGLTIGLSLVAALLAAHALFLAHVKGNAVRVTPWQLPDLYGRCRAAAMRLRMRELPEIYVMQAGGVLNAFATKLLSRRFVVVYSELVNQCEDPRQLDFIIGHELGHLAAGHLTWNAFLLPALVMPWLGPALSRAREYTCDQCGLAVAGDLEAAKRGLVVLAAGGRLARDVDLDQFEMQRLETGSFWMAVRELCASHPYLCKRVAALRGSAAVERNLVAWVVAPFFGVLADGSSMMALVLVYSIVIAMRGG